MKLFFKMLGYVWLVIITGSLYLIYFSFLILKKILFLLYNLFNSKKRIYDMDVIDSMTGLEFENAFAKILKYNDYHNVTVTQGSGDYGIDVLAEKNNLKYAFQCKLYSNKVGLEAVQQAMSGCLYYGSDISVVITNNYFTPQAIKLAKRIGVELWDRNILYKLNQE